MSYDTRVGFDTPPATATLATAHSFTVPVGSMLAFPAESALFYVLTVPNGVRVYVHVAAVNNVGTSPVTPLVSPSVTQVSITARQAPATPASVAVTTVRRQVSLSLIIERGGGGEGRSFVYTMCWCCPGK